MTLCKSQGVSDEQAATWRKGHRDFTKVEARKAAEEVEVVLR